MVRLTPVWYDDLHRNDLCLARAALRILVRVGSLERMTRPIRAVAWHGQARCDMPARAERPAVPYLRL